MMKSALFLFAGTILLGSANGGVHKLKLQKLPPAEQQEYVVSASQAGSLARKYSSQEYMGLHPHSAGEMFKDTPGHPVPVANFKNAQCMTLVPQ